MNKRICQSTSMFVIVVGCLVLLGWQLDIPLLKSGFPGSASTMKPNTALCFLLLGISLKLLQSQKVTQLRHQIAKGMALLVLIIGLLTISEYYFNWNLGIDQLLGQDSVPSPMTPYPGRMGINTAVNFIFMAVALLWLERDKPKDIVLAHIFSSIAAIISLFALLGHLLGVSVVTSLIPYTSTQALHTAVTFLVFYAGLLLVQPKQGLMQVFTSPLMGGRLARRLIPWIVLFPLFLNMLVLTGYEKGWYDIKAAYGIEATLTIISLFMVVWCSAYWLNRIENDRIQAQKALTESQQQFQQAIEAANLGTWKWDILTGKINLSSQSETLLRFKPGSFEGTYQALINLLHPNDLDVLSNSLQVALLNGSRWQMDYQILDPDGSKRWITSVGKFLYDPAGEAVQMIGILKDITAHKQAELNLTKLNETLEKRVSERTAQLSKVNHQLQEQLLERQRLEEALLSSQARLLGILEIASDAIISVDKEQKIILFNQEAEEIFGYSSQEVLGQPLSLLLPDRFKFSHHHQVTKFAQSSVTKRGIGKRVEISARRKDGIEFPAEASISKLEIGNETILTAILQDISDRKKIQEALRNSEERWQLALRGNNDGIWDWDVITNEVFFSTRWKEMLGYQDHEIVNDLDEWSKRVHPDDLESVTKQIQAHFAKQTPFYISEHRVLCKDGNYKWILDRGQALWDENGQVVRMAGSHTDITERKKIEEALQEKTAEFEAIFEYIPDAIIFTDTNRRIQRVNSAFTTLFGYLPDEILGKTTEILYESPEKYHEQSRTGYNLKGKEDKKPYEIRYRRKNGTTFVAETVGSRVKNEQQNLLGFIGIVRDITERKQADEQLNQFRNVLENALEGISQLDTHGRYLKVNKAYANLVGYEPEEMIGMMWQPTVHFSEQEKMTIAYQTMLNEGKVEAEVKGVRKDGSVFYKQVTMISAYNQQGEFIGHYCFAKDITERKEAEVTLQKYAHEIRDLYNNAPCGYHSLDSNGVIVYINDTELNWLGYTRDQVIGKLRFCDLLTPSSKVVFQRQFEKFKKRGWAQDLEFELIREDGEILSVLINATAIKDIEGNFVASRSTMFDISERKKMETALQKSEERFQAFMNNAPILAWINNLAGMMIYGNQALFKLLQKSEPEVIGYFLTDVFPEDLAEEYQQNNLTVARSGEVLETIESALQPDGSIRDYLVRKFPIGLKGQDCWVGGIAIDITEQQIAESALRTSEARFRQIAENIQEVFFINSADLSEVIYISPAYEKIWGRTCQSLYDNPCTWLESLHPDDRQQVATAITAQQQGEPFEQEYRIIRPDGSIRWIYSRAFPLYNDSGQLQHYVGLATDLSDRKQSEEALQQSEARFRELAESIRQVFYLLEATGEILYISPAYEQIWGRTCESLYDDPRSWLASVHPEDFSRVATALENQIQKGQHFDEIYRIIRPNQEIRWIHSQSYPNFAQNGQIYHFPGFAEDITPRKLAEDALEHQLNKTLLLQKITDKIRQSLDSNEIFQTAVREIGEAFEVNRCLLHTYIKQPVPKIPLVAEYLSGKGQSALILEVPVDNNPHVQKLLDSETAIALDDVYQEPLLYNAQPLCRQIGLKSMLAVGTFYQGKPNGILGLHQCDRYRHWTTDEIELLEAVAAQVGIAIAHADLLEGEKQRLKELSQKNKALAQAKTEAEAANKAKSEFLANMSHEIRTPMNAVLGFTDLLHNLVTENQAKQYLEAISASGRTLLRLINDILDLSKIEAGKLTLHFEPIDLRVLITEIEQIFLYKAREKGLHLYSEIDPNLPSGIELDEVRLRQILLNVVGNALKFTDTGEIKITVSCSPLLAQTEKIELKILVEDTGIGISPNNQKRIFEAFTQSEGQSNRKYGGTGLGLAITERLVQMMGGSIDLQSQLGQGSKFTFYFSQVAVSHQSSQEANIIDLDDNLNQFQTSKILVVDDVASNRHLIDGYFTGTTHQLLFAEDGHEALQIAQNHHPDVILLDLRMPNLDGRETAQILKQEEKTQDIPIIIVTASSEIREEIELKKIVEGFLRKPVSRPQLVAALSKVLKLAVCALQSTHQEILSVNMTESPSVETPIDLSELLIKLCEEAENTLPLLRKKMAVTELENFTEKLKVLGQKHQYQLLLNYAHTLQEQLDEYDWDKIPQTLEQFLVIFNSLKQLINNGASH